MVAAILECLELLSSHDVLPQSYIHMSGSLNISRKWEKNNKTVYTPQLPGEPRRPTEIYHCQYLKSIRYHGRGRFGIMEMVFCHYFVKLVEGTKYGCHPCQRVYSGVPQPDHYSHSVMVDSDSTVYIFCHLFLKNKDKCYK
ncbi:unnamed protein product [Nyctereutes procyonoides]|uniref:(raccoon dog) hypothetical protein n=1 Tax=Nyctereutes procyonoides TaxID=34880 RepID=A0A811ZY91_NYCPR|nr:unnamed protein product [Nyctereutes procyonoides]